MTTTEPSTGPIGPTEPTEPNGSTEPTTPNGGTEPTIRPDSGTNTEAPASGGTANSGAEPDTFPRAYVEQLRQESAGYRTRAQQADTLAQRLHLALVTATGRLADPSDLPFDAAHLDDAQGITAAVDELLARKPHLTSRTPRGDVGQGATAPAGTVDLAGMLRARAT